MRETNFIKQNKDKWQRFEKMLKLKQNDPRKLSRLFIEITDDLSYSRTFYPNRSVRVYLNSLAQQIFYNVYKNKRAKRRNIFSFWTDELPQVMYGARGELLLSTLIFLTAILIGVFSTIQDPDFPRIILGDGYVDQTIQNIENGDPMAVYKDENEVFMSLWITYNNVRVGMLSFLSGLAAGIGTIGVLLYNGIMVGAFQYMFYDYGAFRESFLTIWIHGTLEISTIILAGCAGLTLGRGIVFPGTYSRLQSLRKYGIRSLKIMMGIIPLIIAAGFIEGFVTRYTDAPDILRLGIIFASLAFVLLYFVWYPYQKNIDGFENPITDAKIPPSRQLKINYQEIKNSAEIFMQTFQLYAQSFLPIFRASLVLAGVYVFALVAAYGTGIGNQIGYYNAFIFWDWLTETHFRHIGQFYDYAQTPILILTNTLILGTIIYMSAIYFVRSASVQLNKDRTFGVSFHIISWLASVGIWGIFNTLLWFSGEVDGGNAIVLLAFVLLPFLQLWLMIMLTEGRNPFVSLGNTFRLAGGRIGLLYGVYIILLLLSFMFSYIISSPLLSFLNDIILFNFSLDAATSTAILSGMLIFLFTLFCCLLIPVFIISSGLLYVSLKEINEANALMSKIENIGTAKRTQGLEQE